jgi:site-specific recombinase XerD
MIMARRVRGPLDGPLAPYGAGFEASLAEQGYSADSISRHLRVIVQMSRWLDRRGLGAADLSVDCAGRFLRFRRAGGHTHPASIAGMAPLLDYLRNVGIAPSADTLTAVTPVEGLLGDYRCYLLEERGLSQRTSVPHYVDVACSFLASRSISGVSELGRLTSAEVSQFMLSASRRYSVGHTKSIGTRLRSFLRYLEMEGLTSTPLAGAVPSVAGWQLVGLPQTVSTSEVSRLLESCDRARPSGCRDFAILSVLARLGLRAGEVAALRLDDIDWRVGVVRVHGKGNRDDGLPLPWDVGEAIVEWLTKGRPSCSIPSVFTRVLAPHRGLSDRAVSGVVRQACGRAGLPPMGSHRLRHTVATETLRAGGSLIEVADLLRQRNTAATALYAKVDRRALAAVAQPWPGGAA